MTISTREDTISTFEHHKQNELKAMREYIKNSWSKWHIEQYVITGDKDDILHLEWAIRRGLEEHIEELILRR